MNPKIEDMVKWYHYLLVLPLKILTRLGVGPFGGQYSVAAMIEAVIADQRKKPLEIELTKTERFLFEKIRTMPEVEGIVGYRTLNHDAQEEVLKRWKSKALGVLWIGGGVFTLEHPFLAQRKDSDWNTWTDAHPRVVSSAQQVFHHYHQKREGFDLSSYEVLLPRDIKQLNYIINFQANHGIEHLVIQGYGVTYALTFKENLAWLKALEVPPSIGISFIFNSLQGAVLPGRLMAAMDNQKMVRYEEEHVKLLFNQVFPQCEIVWSKTLNASENQQVVAWLIEVPPRG